MSDAATTKGPAMSDRAALVLQRAKLAQRLDDGWRRIEQGIVAGQDVAAWEHFWIGLLREYEAVSDQLDRPPEGERHDG